MEIKPVDVKRFLCMKAHNNPDPDINRGAGPTNGRSQSLEFAKKAISHCMPHKGVPWCSGQDNPTKFTLADECAKVAKTRAVLPGVASCLQCLRN